MSDFRYEVEIRVPPSRVWSVLLDVERWPEWTTSVTRIQRMEVGPISMGSRARIWQPRLRPAVWCVTSLDEKRRIFAWTTRAFGLKIIGRHQVEAVTELHPPHPLRRVLRPPQLLCRSSLRRPLPRLRCARRQRPQKFLRKPLPAPTPPCPPTRSPPPNLLTKQPGSRFNRGGDPAPSHLEIRGR